MVYYLLSFLLLAIQLFSINLQAKSHEELIGRLPPRLTKEIPADITFLIADLKYDKNMVKIIEFGSGVNAGYKVLDHTYGKGLIFRKFWKYLEQFRLPIWHVRDKPKVNSITRAGRYSWYIFNKINGHRIKGLHNLNKNKTFKQAIRKQKGFSLSSIKNHHGIVLLRGRRVLRKKIIQSFKRKYPRILFINEASYDYANYKDLTASLFNTPKLQMYRPKTGIYPRKYTSNLSKQILSKLTCEWLVIKPIFSGKGNGIIMINRDELESTLELILKKYNNNKPYNNSFNFRPNKPLVYDYWKKTLNSHFLVEEYVSSKELIYKNKPYDATIRVIFTLHHDDGNIYFNYLDGYWKRPVKALTDQGTFRQRHLSKHYPNKRQSQGGKISNDDKENLIRILKQFIGDVYQNILTNYHIEKRSSIFSNFELNSREEDHVSFEAS